MDCGYLLEPPRPGGSNKYHNLCFEQKYEKYQMVKFSIYLNGRVFVMLIFRNNLQDRDGIF